MKKTQQEYGFDHTGIIIGKVVNTDKKFQLDFDGKLYHLRADLQSSGQKPWYKTWLLHLKEVSGQWEEKVKHANAAANKSSDNNGNKWQGKRNDCEEYVKAFEKAL
ncbi:hypothetical protein BDV27DRAFT_154030 [Aspergillus caelatus]|uniref:Uncharacterized protein n=1 Tax=Aspergillus caelatus TaxID=61420 RepID=A0A5N7AFH4_9EURO|nr:uncharacterized protein BDV27DRAFT_154030 [Aspergillus caelatus]KAE8368475.1 hypothetical protein BDV27DRAFT_154030 [Aspergillus caelatus]